MIFDMNPDHSINFNHIVVFWKRIVKFSNILLLIKYLKAFLKMEFKNPGHPENDKIVAGNNFTFNRNIAIKNSFADQL